MAQPERNKTDCDKAREEALITRLVEVRINITSTVNQCVTIEYVLLSVGTANTSQKRVPFKKYLSYRFIKNCKEKTFPSRFY